MAQKSPTGAMPTLRFARIESSLGPMWVVESDLGVVMVSRDEPFGPLQSRFPGSLLEPGDLDGAWVERAIKGGGLPPIDERGLSSFDVRVYDVVREVPPGETITYGEVAVLIGSPGAARAVGGAMSRCPLFPAVPCHRVVRASYGWSGWGGDDRLKRRLLAAERATS
jgi:AraC family transcriptional regulator, regulatory protein of adaptative response / methylated-DNA-[protein]-cysteine methyltransferase